MRNLKEFPIEKEEILACLTSLIEEMAYEKTGLIGDMRPLLLAKAYEIVQQHTGETPYVYYP